MDYEDVHGVGHENSTLLPVSLPFIWPEGRFHQRLAGYAEAPPSRGLLSDADLISGLLVGIADDTIDWLCELLKAGQSRRARILVVLSPAGPTRERHLRILSQLAALPREEGHSLDVRLIPIGRLFDDDCERSILPPTIIQAHNTTSGATVMSVGSVGNAGHDPVHLCSLNLVFRPDDALRDAWRRWFQFAFEAGAPLTEESLRVPHLVPAPGDPQAAKAWQEFQQACKVPFKKQSSGVTVDADTGEVVSDREGNPVVAWDEGKTALDPLGHLLQQVYANGWLVTVDNTTVIKPLTIPVKATLLGQQSERTVGAVKQRQSFTLQVLDDDVEKSVEKCRKVTDLMDLLTLPLSSGNRWLPESARAMLEEQIEARNAQGKALLEGALGGNDVEAFINKRLTSIRRDLNGMYQQLGQGEAVPEAKLAAVLQEIKARLQAALDTRITPRAVYNRVLPPDLTSTAPDENWNQPLSLLSRSAGILRESLTDRFFPSRLANVSFSDDEFRACCNPFSDLIVREPGHSRARSELKAIEEILAAKKPAKEKCRDVWQLTTAETVRQGG